MAEKSIYDLKLHEQSEIHKCLVVTRVPGGWIYEYYNDSIEGTDFGVFVPFNKEFQEAEAE